jgi:hypothetical protein
MVGIAPANKPLPTRQHLKNDGFQGVDRQGSQEYPKHRRPENAAQDDGGKEQHGMTHHLVATPCNCSRRPVAVSFPPPLLLCGHLFGMKPLPPFGRFPFFFTVFGFAGPLLFLMTDFPFAQAVHSVAREYGNGCPHCGHNRGGSVL